MNPAFWKGKTVLVTGHTGFKGGWLSVWLQKLGANVIGYSLAPITESSLFAAARVAEGMTSIEADILDLARISQVIEEHRPEIVIHMAAQALVRTAYDEPVRTFSTNVTGTVNLLEAVRQSDCVRVVVSVTSDKCYENLEWVWAYRENDRLGGHDPYSASKACAELVITAYRDSFFGADRLDEHGLLLASTRTGNVIGGGDWSRDRLVPDILRAIASGQPVSIRRPDSTRPWQFVLEPLRGYLDLAERLWDRDSSFAGPWNFGPDVEQIHPVSWIVEYLTRKWGDGASWKLDLDEHPHEAHFLQLDCTKTKGQLNWSPALDLATTLDWIVEWHRAFERGDDVRAVTEDQIERYDQIARG